jgi:hypothetical protein
MLDLFIKYLLEGIAVAVAAYFIPRKQVDPTEIIFIGLAAAATFALLDIFAPKVGTSARTGAGFGIGARTVGWPAGMERFEDSADAKSADTDSTNSTDASTTESMTTTSSDASKEDVMGFDETKNYSQF